MVTASVTAVNGFRVPLAVTQYKESGRSHATWKSWWSSCEDTRRGFELSGFGAFNETAVGWRQEGDESTRCTLTCRRRGPRFERHGYQTRIGNCGGKKANLEATRALDREREYEAHWRGRAEGACGNLCERRTR